MLTIVIPNSEYFNQDTGEFVEVKEKSLSLEHSLVSISKWEAKWHKPFLGNEQKTKEEVIDYIKCMTLTKNVPPIYYSFLSSSQLKMIENYIDDPMTATTFTEDKRQKSKKPTFKNKKVITNEEIYYWMIENGIPIECQKWHLNRLLTLIRVCNIKNAPTKKMGKKELFDRNRSLNAARRKALGTSG